MLIDLWFIHVQLDPTLLAGMALWSLALYLGFFPVSEWLMDRLAQWMNWVDHSLYGTQVENDRARRGWESQNAFYASLLSILPFLGAGGLCNWLVEAGLGRSWTLSMGLIACVGSAVYELGRRDGRSLE